jgi:glycosyltransferase involved in cell wall biosynthesis
MSYITVFTPTYNRRYTLRRAFESLRRQTFQDFVWLVVDDGSMDGTDELINEFKKEASFPIEYYWKENGGKHTAYNYAHQYIKSEYVVDLDSDDELTDNALELLKKAWESIPVEDYDRFWCVSGRGVDSETGKMAGKMWPVGINLLKGRKQHKEITKIRGDKQTCKKSKIFKKYLFPEYLGVKHVVESTIWEAINKNYDQYCINDIIGIFHTNTIDSILRSPSPSAIKTDYYHNLFCINELFAQMTYNYVVFRALICVLPNAVRLNIPFKDVMKSINKWYKKVLVCLAIPVSICFITLRKIRNVLRKFLHD